MNHLFKLSWVCTTRPYSKPSQTLHWCSESCPLHIHTGSLAGYFTALSVSLASQVRILRFFSISLSASPIPKSMCGHVLSLSFSLPPPSVSLSLSRANFYISIVSQSTWRQHHLHGGWTLHPHWLLDRTCVTLHVFESPGDMGTPQTLILQGNTMIVLLPCPLC